MINRLMLSRTYAGLLRAGLRDRKAISPSDKEWRDMLSEVRREDVVGTWGKVARLKLDSPIMFEPDLFSAWLGGVQPTDVVVRAIKDAAGDPDVKAVVLEINSPGGSVAGWDDIRGAIDQAKAIKPVHALVHDNAFSMGYRIACRCHQIAATPTAMVGSIGTIVMLYDDSAMYAEAGVIATPVASDEFKGQGWPGVALTDEYVEHIRAAIVEPDYAEFVQEVADKTGLSTGEVRGLGSLEYSAADAMARGLVDEVVSADAYVAALAANGPRSPRPAATDGAGKGVVMDLNKLKAQHPDLVKQIEAEAAASAATEVAQQAAAPASFAQLKAQFGGDAAFVVECLDKGLTLQAAQAAWNTKLSEQTAKAAAELKAAKEKISTLEALPPAGQDPVNLGAGGGGNVGPSAGGDYLKLVAAKKAEGMNAMQAAAWVNKNHPAAWKAHAEACKLAMAGDQTPAKGAAKAASKN